MTVSDNLAGHVHLFSTALARKRKLHCLDTSIKIDPDPFSFTLHSSVLRPLRRKLWNRSYRVSRVHYLHNISIYRDSVLLHTCMASKVESLLPPFVAARQVEGSHRKAHYKTITNRFRGKSTEDALMPKLMQAVAILPLRTLAMSSDKSYEGFAPNVPRLLNLREYDAKN